VVLTGGGSAGHLFPNVAVAQALQRMEDTEVLFVGAAQGLDGTLLEDQGLAHELIAARPFPYGVSLKSLSALVALGRAMAAVRRLLRRFQPDVVVAAGGFVSAAVIPVAHWRRIPVLIHVSDALPDRANRLLRRFASAVTLAYAEAERYFPGRRCEVVGQPVRREILEAQREEGYEHFGLSPELRTLLITGGSQGARRLNRAVQAALQELLQLEGWQILHVAGSLDCPDLEQWAARQDFLPSPRYVLRSWAPMAPALAVADLVLSRAGSSSLAEICARGVPSIIVPYPHAARHQEANAAPLAKAGAAQVVADDELDGTRLLHVVKELVADARNLHSMSEAAARLATPGAAARVAELALELAGKGDLKGRA